MEKDVRFLQLWDLYSPLLTATQREITDLYFNYDLSLGEIAEQKGVSRQSVSDCLQKCRKQLEKYEAKLSFNKALTDLLREYSAYMTQTERWISEREKDCPQFYQSLQSLRQKLQAVHKEFGTETSGVDDGNGIFGKVFREEL